MDAPPLLYLNVDTQRTGIDVGGWHPEKMGVSVAVVLDGAQTRIFSEQDITALAAVLESADQVIGYNLEGFDFKVLSAYREMNLGRIKHLDLMRDVEKAIGHRVSLSQCAAATLGITGQHDGVRMVQCWKDGKIEEVTRSCGGVARRIKALHEYGRDHGHIFFAAVNGNERRRMDVKW